MVVDTISDFLVSNNYTKKFIAIDYGLKHIGMAISDPSNIISVPYGTFTETLLFEKIIEIIIKIIEVIIPEINIIDVVLYFFLN